MKYPRVHARMNEPLRAAARMNPETVNAPRSVIEKCKQRIGDWELGVVECLYGHVVL